MAHSRELRAVIGLMRVSLGLVPTEEQLQALSDANPNAIVRIASAHAVLPLLSHASGNARVREFVPTDLGLFLAEMQKANSERNTALRQQLIAIGEALHGAGISAVALKGAIELLAPVYPHGARYIGDLDILVPEDELEAAADCLSALGYTFHRAEDHPAVHHHLPVLWHAEQPTGVELHRRLATGLADDILPASLVIAEARPTDAAGLTIPSPRCRLLHLLIHGQMSGVIGKPRHLFLRDLAELARLSPLLNADDWAFARARFEAAGALVQLDGFCETARILLYATEDRTISTGAAEAWATEAVRDLQAPGQMRVRYAWSWLRFYMKRFFSDRAARMRYLQRLSDYRTVAATIRHHAQSLRNIA